jgi:hypothetical protein
MRTLLNSFILPGAIQGLIVSALLFSSARRDPAGGRPKRLRFHSQKMPPFCAARSGCKGQAP